MSAKSKQDSLLAAIQQKAPIAAQTARTATLEDSAIKPEATMVPVAKNRAGKPVQFWLHEEDRRLLRELSAWLAGQGERPTDSMVMRSALRVAKTGDALLKAYRQASALDGRLKQRETA
jgi:hypothetical protein